MNKLVFEIKAVVNKVVQDITHGYKNIFKASIVLIGIFLIGLSQSLPKIIEYDNKAKEIIFIIQAQENKLFKNIDCNTLENNAGKCNYAKYLESSNNTSSLFAGNIIGNSLVFGILLFALAIIGYIRNAIKYADIKA